MVLQFPLFCTATLIGCGLHPHRHLLGCRRVQPQPTDMACLLLSIHQVAQHHHQYSQHSDRHRLVDALLIHQQDSQVAA